MAGTSVPRAAGAEVPLPRRGQRPRRAWRNGGHHDAVVVAEARRLRMILDSYGPLPRGVLRRVATAHGREVDLDTALRAGVQDGLIVAMGFDFYEASAADPAPSRSRFVG